MNMRSAILAVTIVLTLPAAAWDYVGPDSHRITCHYRVAGRPGTSFGIRMTQGDTTFWNAITVKLPDVDVDELFNRTEARIIYTHIGSDGKQHTDSTLRVPFLASGTGYPELSLRISTRDSIAHISFGEKEAVYTASLTIDNSRPIQFCCFKDKKATEIRRTLRATLYPEIEQSKFNDIDSLTQYLAASTDPYEGIWKYYDRSFNTLKVPDTGRYNIATVKSDQGYSILYLSTDDNVPTRLRQLDIKGLLNDSGFDGIYNLDWRDPQGWPTDQYASAQFEGDLLTIRFPALDIMLRFARVQPNEN